MKASVAYALEELRALGRALVDGTWRKSAKPITVPQALSIMGEAMAILLQTGADAAARSLVSRLKKEWELE